MWECNAQYTWECNAQNMRLPLMANIDTMEEFVFFSKVGRFEFTQLVFSRK